MKLKDVLRILGDHAPWTLQEDYDNSGLQVGDPDREVGKVLLSLDITLPVVEEAISQGCDVVIAHHPLLFKGVKRIDTTSETGAILKLAINHDVALVAIHTNLDNVHGGVNTALAEKIGLGRLRILEPMEGRLAKIVTFCPAEHAGDVRQALFDAGCGRIGNYDSCSYNLEGEGSFRALEGSDPFVGEQGQLHFEKETRIEAIFPAPSQDSVIHALLRAHPYEEVAYDIYPLGNKDHWHGAGMIGQLPQAMDTGSFLEHLRTSLGLEAFRYAGTRDALISQVAVCGGSGSFLISRARSAGAHAFVTGDIKYHQFFEAGPDMLLCDVGHHESERFVLSVLKELILKKIPTFAVLISETDTNPVRYFI